ncbi:DUF58 domain-containing protein [Roseimicrobium sp. ORNL1]|uniref:DUF58 domain-containing protein n=1 Tax=Roseimicrobium sp. ORNL1 TaxID=2711231 RepID=UPI0013E0FC8E|nr:DUF58 domain-containing protein [Roseimicrobium sp. ORNL1]QIF03046.1 DUF58 domain-containing protein [Roseimicrobium sp. ORNL1]
MLTDPAFIRRLESLYLLARKILGGSLQADRRSTKKGAGITFADYAQYSLGDDYRSIDWRVYAKFESLLIKLFELEEDATIYLLVDHSPSMASKQQYAKELAAALGYIALNTLDRLAVYGLADKLRPLFDPTRGRNQVLPFLRSLEAAPSFGVDTDFTACAREFEARHRRKGLVCVVSDFLFPGGFEEGLSRLQWHKHEVFCLQTLDDNDLKCPWKGDVTLECVETGASQRVTVSPREAKMYEEAITEWNSGLQRTCAKRGLGFVSTTTERPFDEVIQDLLRRGGLVG